MKEETLYEANEDDTQEESDPGGVKHLSKTKARRRQKRCWNYSLDGRNLKFIFPITSCHWNFSSIAKFKIYHFASFLSIIRSVISINITTLSGEESEEAEEEQLEDAPIEQDTVKDETSYEATEDDTQEESDPGGVKHASKTKSWCWQKRRWNYSSDGKSYSC